MFKFWKIRYIQRACRILKIIENFLYKIQILIINLCGFSAGGLVTAVAPVVVECGGLWIGWSGMYDLDPSTPIPEADPSDNAPTAGLLSKQVRLSILRSDQKTKFVYFDFFQFCKSLPNFHGKVPKQNFDGDMPNLLN